MDEPIKGDGLIPLIKGTKTLTYKRGDDTNWPEENRGERQWIVQGPSVIKKLFKMFKKGDMSREIKFRAQRKLNGAWVYGSLISIGEDWCQIIPEGTEYDEIDQRMALSWPPGGRSCGRAAARKGSL